jgi:hypothetical protein
VTRPNNIQAFLIGAALVVCGCGTFTGNPFDGKKPGGGSTTGKNQPSENPGGGNDPQEGPSPGGTGPGSGGGEGAASGLLLSLTGAPNDALAQLWLRFAKVEVLNANSEWLELAVKANDVNLLALEDGASTILSEDSRLPPGLYKDIRLQLDSTQPARLVLPNGIEENPTLASGLIQGFVPAGGFEVAAGKKLELMVDFDTQKSVTKRVGDGERDKDHGRYALSPVLKLLETQKTGTISGAAPANASIVCAYAPGAPKDSTKECAQAVRRTRIKNAAFKLTYLPEGLYDLRFFDASSSYSDKGKAAKSEAGKEHGDED